MIPQAFAWPWNAPRRAIGSPGLTHRQQRERHQQIVALLAARRAIALLPDCLQREIHRRSDALEAREGAPAANAYIRYVGAHRLPRAEKVMAQWRIAAVSPTVTQQIFRGHFDTDFLQFLAARLVSMASRYNRLADMNRADVDRLAEDIAHFIRAELANVDVAGECDGSTLYRWYLHAAAICQQFNVTPPCWQRVSQKNINHKQLGPAVIRMFSKEWWRSRLRRTALQWREHLLIAFGCVSRREHPFASSGCLREWREQKRRTRDFLKSMELEDEEGHRISLIDKYDASTANPAIRRCELMTRIRGFENICQQLGFAGEFCTITAPAAWHATLSSGCPNPAWNGASPQNTQRWFNQLWAKIRARLHRENIRIFGLRVAEPHHDATPHWHLLIFLRPEHLEAFRRTVRDYALADDAHELRSESAKQARFHSVVMDSSKGSATGYLAKYIAKNIDGYALDGERERESGRPLKETSAAATAWASRWRIRQFQFIGGAPVTVWRELRRLHNRAAAGSLSVAFADAHSAADAGDWASYVNAQGGPFVKRDALQVRAFYQPSQHVNQYGEALMCIRGVYDRLAGEDFAIITRPTQWKIVPRRREEVRAQSGPSWSSVTNCTPDGVNFLTDDLSRPLNRRQRQTLTRWLRVMGSRKASYGVIRYRK
ncbi:replication endonuclease [Pluralibacter gergoviae]|uniref:replication endonuclease n=1 Tax=Pluralibacter gergoviae TaxID=61647 RepID=UPI00069F9BD6|nr:replication endonuclease [Pluralibacter gergoviae]ELN2735932.1 replication endonuclease [Pluralibacter gergoviae]